MVLQSPGAMASGKTLTLDSYVNHTFFIKEAPDESGTCNGGTAYSSPSLAPCMTASFTVNDRDDLGKQAVVTFEYLLWNNTNSYVHLFSNSYLGGHEGGSERQLFQSQANYQHHHIQLSNGSKSAD
jgi:hypothetical protein